MHTLNGVCIGIFNVGSEYYIGKIKERLKSTI